MWPLQRTSLELAVQADETNQLVGNQCETLTVIVSWLVLGKAKQ